MCANNSGVPHNTRFGSAVCVEEIGGVARLDHDEDAARLPFPHGRTPTQAAAGIAVKAFSASRDAALETAEKVTRDAGASDAADLLHSLRAATGTVQSNELPVADYDSLNVTKAVTAVKSLEDPADLRIVIAYEEQHKNRHGVVSAAQVRVAGIAREVVGV